jgi:hypothetical protein
MKKWYGFVAVALFTFLLTACGGGTSSSSNDSNSTVDNNAAITSEINNNSELFGTGLTDDNADAQTLSSQALQGDINVLASTTSCQPLAWGRGNLRLNSRNIDISINGDIASVKVVDDISGALFVAATSNNQVNVWDKSLNDTITRYAEFVRVLPGRWNLTKISPVDVDLTDSTQQTVQIQKVAASINNQVVWQATSSSTLYDVPAGLPTFKPNDLLLVEAQISNSTTSTLCSPTTYVFLHRPGLLCPFGRCRDIMYDDGANGGDKVANDGIFSQTYTIGQHIGYHFAAVDVIDAETFMNDTTDYNSTVWGMPYRVVQ